MTTRRSGKSLIELVAVMSILSVIMAITGAAFARMMSVDRAARRAVVSRANLSRLSVQFRNDVRAAGAASLAVGDGDRPQQLNVTRPDGTVAAYRITPEGVERVLRRGMETLGREEYQFPGSRHRFEIDRADPTVMALVQTQVLTTESRVDGTAPAGRVVRIEAVRGRHFHHTNSKRD